jgi:hypothetical protein
MHGVSLTVITKNQSRIKSSITAPLTNSYLQHQMHGVNAYVFPSLEMEYLYHKKV